MMFAAGLALMVLTSLIAVMANGEPWFTKRGRWNWCGKTYAGFAYLISIGLMTASAALWAWRWLP